MEISGLLRPFIIIHREFKFFFHTYIYKSLICVPKLRAPKLDKTNDVRTAQK